MGWKKESFRGSIALNEEKSAGAARRLRGLASNDRGIPRAGMTVKSQDGAEVGVITSGTFSPSLKRGIALALLSPDFAIGDEVIVDVRGRDSSATVIELPMVTSHVR